MGPIAHAERHDGPGLSFELVPGITAVIEDCVSIFEHAVGQPVVADELPDVLRWSREFGQGVKLGLLLRRTDLNDGQAEAVFGGFQGEGCS